MAFFTDIQKPFAFAYTPIISYSHLHVANYFCFEYCTRLDRFLCFSGYFQPTLPFLDTSFRFLQRQQTPSTPLESSQLPGYAVASFHSRKIASSVCNSPLQTRPSFASTLLTTKQYRYLHIRRQQTFVSTRSLNQHTLSHHGHLSRHVLCLLGQPPVRIVD